MFILIEARSAVTEVFATQFGREGVALTAFSPAEFTIWAEGATRTEFGAVEGFLIGDAPERPQLVRAIREKGAAPILALADFGALAQTLDLFACGCDDVVRKPVHVREILARARAIRRRAENSTGVATIGSLRVFFDGRDPEVEGETMLLPRRERRILEFLAVHRGRRVTKQQIFQSIYGLFDDEVEETVVESHVSKLRKKLRRRIGYDPIDSKRYLGYCLVAGAQGQARAEADLASV
ncbi:MAG: response regulator transcription factor [Hyphomicrobiales bacterium]|nr:response regulator transcription factor [Hyphomicrobiales bacterium]